MANCCEQPYLSGSSLIDIFLDTHSPHQICLHSRKWSTVCQFISTHCPMAECSFFWICFLQDEHLSCRFFIFLLCLACNIRPLRSESWYRLEIQNHETSYEKFQPSLNTEECLVVPVWKWLNHQLFLFLLQPWCLLQAECKIHFLWNSQHMLQLPFDNLWRMRR